MNAAIAKANAATLAPPFPKKQPTTRLYVYGSYVDESQGQRSRLGWSYQDEGLARQEGMT
jgi:hypothetical protein